MRPEPTPDVKSHSSFGTVMFGRSWSAESDYRFGFNGSEVELELTIGSVGTPTRSMNCGLGRWLSVDPESISFPSMSGYCLMGNSPLYNVDPGGDKIRGSIGMRIQILKFKIATSKNYYRAMRNGNTGLAGVYNQTLNDLQSLKSSDVVFHFNRKHYNAPKSESEGNFDMMANSKKHPNRGQVDVLVSDNNTFMAIAGATAAGGLLLSSKLSLNESGISKYVEDRTDIKAFFDAQSGWLENANKLDGNQDFLRQSKVNSDMNSEGVVKLPSGPISMNTPVPDDGIPMSYHDLPSGTTYEDLAGSYVMSRNTAGNQAIPNWGGGQITEFFIDSTGKWSSPKRREKNFIKAKQ